jgi:hypothetical protein
MKKKKLLEGIHWGLLKPSQKKRIQDYAVPVETDSEMTTLNVDIHHVLHSQVLISLCNSGSQEMTLLLHWRTDNLVLV